MELNKKERQKIREVLKNTIIDNKGWIEQDKTVSSVTIDDIVELGGYIFYSGIQHRMAIANWGEE